MTTEQEMRKAHPSNVIFFLCDLQGAFRQRIQGFKNIVRVAQKMVKAGATLDVPLVVTEQNPEKLGTTVEELDINHAAFRARKMQFSMVTPELTGWLKEHPERNSIVLFGIEAHVCIIQTVRDLLDNGYEVTVIADGTLSQQLHNVKLSFDQMRHWGASIVPSDSLLFQLIRSADHEKFRAISALVKEGAMGNNNSEPFPHDTS